MSSPSVTPSEVPPSLGKRLQAVTESLAAARTQEDVFGVVLTPALQALNAIAGAILLVDVTGTRLEIATTHGYEEAAQTLWQDGPLNGNVPAGDALERHEPLFFEQEGALVRAYPELEARTGGVAAVATAVLPMFLDEQPLGVIVLDFKKPHDFTPEEERFLRILSAQCAIALGRARLSGDLERRVQERTAALDAFVAFSEVSAGTTDVHVLARHAVDVLRATLGEVSVAYYDLVGDLWKARVWSDDFAPEVAAVLAAGIPVDAPSCAEATQTREAVFVPGWEAEREGVAQTEAYGAGAFFPCFVGDTPRGLMAMGTRRSGDWSEREQAVFRALGRSLTLALERAEAAAQLEARTRQIEEEAHAQEAFVAFSEAVGTETDLLTLIRQAVDVLRVRFSECSVGYYGRDGDLWKLLVWTDDLETQPELLAALRAGLPTETPNITQTLRARQMTFKEGWDPEREHIADTDVYGAVGVYPLMAVGEVHGLVSVGLKHVTRWDEHDRAILRAVGRGLDTALERTEQTRRLEIQNAELGARTRALEGFAELTRDLTSHHDPYLLIQRAQEVVLALLPDGYALYFEPQGERWVKWAQSGELRSEALQAVADVGLPYHEAGNLLIPYTTLAPYYQDQYAQDTDNISELVAHLGASATFPVLVEGRPRGVFAVVLFGKLRPWSGAERAVMETVVRSLGLALERASGAIQLAQSHRELERERTFLRAVLESLAEGVVACDPGGRLTLFNDATRNFHGMEASPLPPEAWTDHYDLFEGDGVTPLVTERIPLFRAWCGEQVREAEMVIRPKTGPARRIVANGRAIFTGDGEPLGAVVAMHDLTARKQAEDAVRDRTAELERSNAELEQFAYIASHDLQAPIRAVTSFAELIDRRYGKQLDERGRLYLRQIVEGGEHMKRLVDDLLAFSRLHTHRGEPLPVDAEAVFDTVARRLQTESQEARAQVTRKKLPRVLVDALQFDQLLQNLIANGLKYHREGVPPQVHVSAERDGEMWRFAV